VNQELVTRAIEGDRAAYDGIVRLVIADFDLAANLILGSRQHAREAVTETLVRGWAELRSLDESGRFEPWLRQKFVRSCLSRIQRGTGAVIDEHPNVAAAAAAPSKDEERLRDALLGLEPKARIVVVLRDLLEIPLEEAAAALRLSPSAAVERLDRARRALRGAPHRQVGPGNRSNVSSLLGPDAGLSESMRSMSRDAPVPYLGDVLRRIDRTGRGRLPLPRFMPASRRPTAVGPSALLMMGLIAAVLVVAAPALLGGRQPKGGASPVASPTAGAMLATGAPPTPEPQPEIAVDCQYPELPFEPELIELTGSWAGDDGGIYYIRQDDQRIWWNGLSGRDGDPMDLGREWNNVGMGVIRDDLTIDVKWADVPRGGVLGSGTLTLRIHASGTGAIVIRKIAETGTGFGNEVWRPCAPR
jgi:RNA polymerase sigma-70 factor, ECF subfamily